MRYCSVSSFDLDLLYYVTMNACSREFGHSLSLHGNEYERRTPDVSGMTICASCMIRGSGHCRALLRYIIYMFVRKRAVYSYAIDKDGDLISAQPDIALLG